MKKRNILSNIAKVMAGSLLAVTVLTAVSPALAAYADVNDDKVTEEAGTEEAAAEKTRKEFPDRSMLGSITVKMEAKQEKIPEEEGGDASEIVKLNAGTLELFKLADVIVDNGFKFAYTKDFSGIEHEITEEDSSLNQELIDAAVAAIENGQIQPSASADVTEGAAVFGKDEGKSSLELGLYLIRQSPEDTAESIGYKPISTFLVTIPYYYEDEKTEKGELKAIYDVTANAKIELDKEKELELTPCKADPPVQKFVTGDGAPEANTFSFIMHRENSVYPMPGEGANDDKDEISLSVTTAKNGSEIRSEVADGEFGIINFEKIGSYTYTIKEDPSALPEGFEEGYDTTVYTITYVVNADPEKGLVVSEMIIDNSKTNENTTIKVNDKFAGPDAFVFKFTNPYKAPEPETETPTESSSSEPETTEPETTRRKQSENTPRDRSTVGPPAEAPTVAGAYREPEGGGEEAGVLGAARTPQAVLGASRLPQTGQLWWPVPILMICGIALMAGGLVKRRSDE